MEDIIALKKCVALKFGQEIKTTSNCKSLAGDIFLISHQHIGLNTLKRFFGIEKYTGSHRDSTSDVLAFYCGFKNFQDFKKIRNPLLLIRFKILGIRHIALPKIILK